MTGKRSIVTDVIVTNRVNIESDQMIAVGSDLCYATHQNGKDEAPKQDYTNKS